MPALPPPWEIWLRGNDGAALFHTFNGEKYPALHVSVIETSVRRLIIMSLLLATRRHISYTRLCDCATGPFMWFCSLNRRTR
jgi:hypothetical protein